MQIWTQPIRDKLLYLISINNGIETKALVLRMLSLYGQKQEIPEIIQAIRDLINNKLVIELLYTDSGSDGYSSTSKTLLFSKGTKFMNLQEILNAHGSQTKEAESVQPG
jgi:hypothetical protein